MYKVPQNVAYPQFDYEGRKCTAYPKPPSEVSLVFQDGSCETISIDLFRSLPRNKHLIIRDEFWDSEGGNADQLKITKYLYG